jgi:hypothetical protein
MKVYHYTSQESHLTIISERTFYPSCIEASLDSTYGEGWYFTTLSPETPNDELEQLLWQRSEPRKSKKYLVFEIDDSLLQPCRAHVFRLKKEAIKEGAISLNITYEYTATKKMALKFIDSGSKPIKFKDFNPFQSNNSGFGSGSPHGLNRLI